jgi:hypothetical protein
MAISDALRIRLADKARAGAGEYQAEYADSFMEIIRSHEENADISGVVKAVNPIDAAESLKISCLYNEITYLDCSPGAKPLMLWVSQKGFRELVGDDGMELTLTGNVPPELLSAAEKGQIGVGFFFPGDEDQQRFLSDASYLVADGRLVPRPARSIHYLEKVEDNGRKNWHILTADPATGRDSWRVSIEGVDGEGVDSLSFESKIYGEDSVKIMADLTLPYIDGISLSEYARVIRDEGDILTEFRKEMKSLADMASSGSSNLVEFRRDVIDLRIAKIERKFKHIAGMYRLRMAGAALTAGTLALLNAHTKGNLAGLEVLVGGLGAASMAKDTIDRANQVGGLKDDPLYLFWKMNSSTKVL